MCVCMFNLFVAHNWNFRPLGKIERMQTKYVKHFMMQNSQSAQYFILLRLKQQSKNISGIEHTYSSELFIGRSISRNPLSLRCEAEHEDLENVF